MVAGWRLLIRGKPEEAALPDSSTGLGWVPVPVTVQVDSGDEIGILSWSGSSMRYPSLHEALRSHDAERLRPDLSSQATYYMECTLARLHGVQFGSTDYIVDEPFERGPALATLASSMIEQESRRIADSAFGLLSKLG